MNWGPLSWLNVGWKTFGWWGLRRGSFDEDFHTYGLEWDEDFMCILPRFLQLFNSDIISPHPSRIYVDTKLHHMLDLKIDKSFFDLGDFPPVVQNATDILALENPWINGTKAAPFDQCAIF